MRGLFKRRAKVKGKARVCPAFIHNLEVIAMPSLQETSNCGGLKPVGSMWIDLLLKLVDLIANKNFLRAEALQSGLEFEYVMCVVWKAVAVRGMCRREEEKKKKKSKFAVYIPLGEYCSK